MQWKYNIDALKLCLISDTPDLYQSLIKKAKNGLIERLNYTLHIKEETDQSLELNVITNNLNLLGVLTITNQRSDNFDGKHYFTANNQALYTPFTSKDSNLLCLVDYVFQNEGLHVNNVTRIELALDTSKNIIQRLDKLIKTPNLSMLYNNKLVKTDERLNNAFYIFGRTRAKRDRQPSLYFKGCHTKVKVYNKLQEINVTSDKYYIRDYDAFTANKLFRLEVTLDREAWLNSIPELADLEYNPENWLAYLLDETTRGLIWNNAISRVIRFKNFGQELNLLHQLGLL